jgi:hypothetical protein
MGWIIIRGEFEGCDELFFLLLEEVGLFLQKNHKPRRLADFL